MNLEQHGKRVVLVIDDERAILDVLEILLRRQNYEVLTASNLKEASQIWATHRTRISAVVSDKHLTVDEDCAVFLCGLREQAPRLPLIVMSGDMPGESERFLPGWKEVVYLTKPFEPNRLFKALNDCIYSFENAA